VRALVTLVTAHTLLGQASPSHRIAASIATIRLGRLVSGIHTCRRPASLSATWNSSRRMKPADTQSPQRSPMSFTKIRRGRRTGASPPSTATLASHGLPLRIRSPSVAGFQRAAAAMRPGNSTGSSNRSGCPLCARPNRPVISPA
jgi:hypothetical protein